MDDAEIKIDKGMFIEQISGPLRERYRIGNVIGEGAFGQVREVRLRENTDIIRACKVITKANMDKNDHDQLHNEFNNLKDLDHPNILKIFELFEDEKRYYIVTELCKGGELFDELMDRGGSISEHDVAVIMHTVLNCINYCH